MFQLVHRTADLATYVMLANRTVSVCLLSIVFSLFFLIISILFINTNIYVVYCEFKKPENDIPQFLCDEQNSKLAVERYVASVTPVNIKSVLDSNFLPDVNDIPITDESSVYPQPNIQTGQGSVDNTDWEALTSLKMALKFKQMNNLVKAQKLFQHALALRPNHHDILLHYGEFLESGEDFINADNFYWKALMLQPKDSRALINHEKILPVVNQLDLEVLNRIDSKRAKLVELNKKDPSLKRLKKEIYFQHIYHTVAIEGNTMSLTETRTVVETGMVISGKSIIEHNEILGLEAALRHLNQTLANKNSNINVSDILDIHRRVLGYADPVNAGTFRKSQIYVGNHTPPAPSEVDLLMNEFFVLLQPSKIKNMHPIHIAAFAHYKLVYIHPFLDGNGRTARLLMNYFFLKYGFPPIIIRKEERIQYFRCLQFANEGDIRPFYRFIANATEYTIDAFLSVHNFQESRIKALESINDAKDVIYLGI